MKGLTVRRRILLNNFIMVIVPVLVLALIGSGLYYSLRATGSFRERELELFWPEEGAGVPVHLALSHLRAHVDWHWKEKTGARTIQRHCRTLEKMGVRVAVIDDGKVIYETDAGSAFKLLEDTYRIAPEKGNAFIWDERGLTYRYMSEEQHSIAVARGPVPFQLQGGFFPDEIEVIIQKAAIGITGLLMLIIVVVGVVLSRHLSQHISHPLNELRLSAKAIGEGDYSVEVPELGDDELGETASAFESMRRQLIANRELREKYEQNRRRLLADIAHDLSTPLTKIKGYTSGILDGIADTEEKRLRYLQRVNRTSDEMQRLVRELFTLSKLELNQLEVTLTKTNIVAFVQEYVTEYAESLSDNNFRFTFENGLSGETPAFVQLDNDLMTRVLDNILSNSIKYRREHGSLNIRLYREADSLCLDFIDNGCGVADEELDKLFDSFYRTDKARTGVAAGSGLGLAITKRIIEQLRGEIWAQATEPQGLTICIRLPMQEDRI